MIYIKKNNNNKNTSVGVCQYGRETCPTGFDLPQSEMHLTSSNHVGPSDAVNGPTVVKKHLRNSRH